MKKFERFSMMNDPSPAEDPVPPIPPSDPPPLGSIGAILVETGRLARSEADLVIQYQRDHGKPFGQAAVDMGLVEPADIRFALARQFLHPCLPAGDTSISSEVMAAFSAVHPVVEQMHHLREQLTLLGFAATAESRAVAVLSAEAGAGRSFVAANLAVVFAQLGHRTLLIDAHLQRPRQHALFRGQNRNGLSTILAGRNSKGAFVANSYLPTFALLMAGPTAPNPQDLLARPTFPELLRNMADKFDVIIVDAPPWLEGSGARTVAAVAGSAIVVARTRHTPADGAARVARELGDARISTYGVVLNRH